MNIFFVPKKGLMRKRDFGRRAAAEHQDMQRRSSVHYIFHTLCINQLPDSSGHTVDTSDGLREFFKPNLAIKGAGFPRE